MTFEEYDAILTTAIYPDRHANLVYPAMGIAGEGGEYLDKIKKIYRKVGIVNVKPFINEEQRQELLKELGDVLWYIAASASELRSSLEEVASLNMKKLLDRKARGVIQGEGDNR